VTLIPFSLRVLDVVQEAAPVNATDAFKLVRRTNVVPTLELRRATFGHPITCKCSAPELLARP
jgi:hypothetical protein